MVMDVKGLVDADQGLVSRRIFIEREIYEQELERIFARCWLFLCHESQIPEALMGWASDFRISESNQRHFYRRWAELMSARSWAEV